MSVKILFSGSVMGGREDADLYRDIVNELCKYGTVLSEWQRDEIDEQKMQSFTKNAKWVHEKCIGWVDEADVIVAEVSVISHGVGMELGRAELRQKPILCLYRPDDAAKGLSPMIDGAHNGTTFIVKRYKQDEMKDILRDYFSTFKKDGDK